MNKRPAVWMCLWSLLCAPMFASEATHSLDQFEPNLRDVPSLQRGAKLYLNYCIGCHSLKYQRYEKTADDLQIPHDVALQQLIFTGQKIGGLMESGMPPESNAWFGAPPPDLTMVARVRGVDWLYTYLRTFYVDDKRPFGVNNLVFQNVGMPNVLAELQGVQRKGCTQVPMVDANGAERRDPLVPGRALTHEQCDVLIVDEGSGKLSAVEFDLAVRDIVNFLYYTGEPARLDRQRIGVYVLLFLVVLFVFAHLLGREYWKDIH